MAQLRHYVDAIVAQVVDRLRWGVPTSSIYAETDNNTGSYTLGRDRDIALATGSLPFVDVRLGDETPVASVLGKYTADLQVHVDLYARATDGQEVSRALARLRLLTTAVLMRPSFKGAVQTSSLVDLNLSPYVLRILPAGAGEVSTFREGEIGIGTMRTTWVVRYAVNPLGLLLPDVNPAAFYASTPEWASASTDAATIQSDVATAPDATMTADRMIPTASTGLHSVGRTLTTTTTKELKGTLYAKVESTLDKVSFSPGGNNTQVHFDLTNLTVTKQSNVGVATITDVGDGWRKLEATWPGDTETYTRLRWYASAGTVGLESYLGDGVSGLLYWGEALEVHNAFITDDGTSGVGWSITTPASNGMNADLTTLVWIVDDADGFAVTPEKVRDGLLQTGATPADWHGFQAYGGQTVTGTFDDLAAGDYQLHIVQIAGGILDSTGPVTLEFTKAA